MADVTDSAATSLESALATRTFDDDDETENVDRRQLGVNPDTAPIDASSNTRDLSRFIVIVEVSEPEEEKWLDRSVGTVLLYNFESYYRPYDVRTPNPPLNTQKRVWCSLRYIPS